MVGIIGDVPMDIAGEGKEEEEEEPAVVIELLDERDVLLLLPTAFFGR